MRRALTLVCCCALAACATTRRPLPPPSAKWEPRVRELQNAGVWQLDGRAAVAVREQGWQATLNWRQADASTEVHLSGPLGIGAMVLKQTPEGLSLNGAPPSDVVLAQVQEKLGFDLPIDNLHYWLLGVPNPGSTYDLSRNEQDRAKSLDQAGWVIAYDRYMPVAGDLLPQRLVLTRQDVRVRIVIDHWDWPK
ncbi:MAG TPA: lipoprotein insertase outer membrane protein LolB [Steroidobacteraceae bacterium]|jgi:outer membrane lipoprotein LolB|nr:lipoprotein insertase outer membrane protein LolB [Steroidobacteraceae bacterium]